MPQQDKYDQFMYLQCTMSAANTLTFAEAAIGVSLFDYAALIISRIEYYFGKTILAEFAANADELSMAVCGSNSISGIGAERPEVYDRLTMCVADYGTAASAELKYSPVIHDYSSLTGGGLIVPAQNMYIAAFSQGFAAAAIVACRVYYRVQKLQAADFIELVQRLRVIST